MGCFKFICERRRRRRANQVFAFFFWKIANHTFVWATFRNCFSLQAKKLGKGVGTGNLLDDRAKILHFKMLDVVVLEKVAFVSIMSQGHQRPWVDAIVLKGNEAFVREA